MLEMGCTWRTVKPYRAPTSGLPTGWFSLCCCLASCQVWPLAAAVARVAWCGCQGHGQRGRQIE